MSRCTSEYDWRFTENTFSPMPVRGSVASSKVQSTPSDPVGIKASLMSASAFLPEVTSSSGMAAKPKVGTSAWPSLVQRRQLNLRPKFESS